MFVWYIKYFHYNLKKKYKHQKLCNLYRIKLTHHLHAKIIQTTFIIKCKYTPNTASPARQYRRYNKQLERGSRFHRRTKPKSSLRFGQTRNQTLPEIRKKPKGGRVHAKNSPPGWRNHNQLRARFGWAEGTFSVCGRVRCWRVFVARKRVC